MATVMVSKKRKQRYLMLRVAVSEALSQADPEGFLEMGAPPDEYDPEVSTILPRLSGATGVEDVALILHEEFVYWFGPEEASDPATYNEPAAEIWRALRSLGFR